MKQHFVVPQTEKTEDSVQTFGVGSIIATKYKLEEKIGQGSFGMIFKCINIENQEVFAVKLEKRNQRHSSMLVREVKVMMEMKNDKGFAKMQSYGKDDEYNYVVMSYLGRNLDSLLKKCKGIFSTPTVVNVAEQMISLLEALHNKNLIHRDIKPENYVIGYGSNFTIVYLIDFGLAKYYKDSEGNHIPFIEKKGMIGTARYASINAHLGHEQSRRDDLEALGYVLLYFAKGKLPWQNINAETKEEKYEKIKAMKQQYSLEQLCENLPNEFIQYFSHVKTLGFEDAPNYSMLKKLFSKIALDKKIENLVHILDWESLPEYRQRKKYQTVAAFSSPRPGQVIVPSTISKQRQEDKDQKKQDDLKKQVKGKVSEDKIDSGSKDKLLVLNKVESSNSQTKQSDNHQKIKEKGKGNEQNGQTHSNQHIPHSSLNLIQNTHSQINPANNNNNNNNDSQDQIDQSITNINQNIKPDGTSIGGQYLNIPNNEKGTIMHSVHSGNSGGTSKINNYLYSESQDITNEESIKVVDLITKEKQVSNPHTMFQDIRVKANQMYSSSKILREDNPEEQKSEEQSQDIRMISSTPFPKTKPTNSQHQISHFNSNSKKSDDYKKLSSYLGENINDQVMTDHRDVKVMKIKSAFKIGSYDG